MTEAEKRPFEFGPANAPLYASMASQSRIEQHKRDLTRIRTECRPAYVAAIVDAEQRRERERQASKGQD